MGVLLSFKGFERKNNINKLVWFLAAENYKCTTSLCLLFYNREVEQWWFVVRVREMCCYIKPNR